MSGHTRIAFTGTRRGITRPQVVALTDVMTVLRLSAPRVPFDEREFLHGCCVGADRSAHDLVHATRWWKIVGYPGREDQREWAMQIYRGGSLRVVHPVPSGRSPELARNHDMVDDSTILVACPGEHTERLRSGTWATVRYARKKAVPVIIITPVGSII